MSIQITSIEELKKLVRQLDLNVYSIEELKGLMRFVNESYNPDVRRVTTAQLAVILTPCVSFGGAALISLMLVVIPYSGMGWERILAVAAMFAFAALASIFVIRSALAHLDRWREKAEVSKSRTTQPHDPAGEVPTAVEKKLEELYVTRSRD